jgi:hypothetical protein
LKARATYAYGDTLELKLASDFMQANANEEVACYVEGKNVNDDDGTYATATTYTVPADS